MWHVEIYFAGIWIRLPGAWLKRDAAEWVVGQWKQKHKVFTDPFRYVQVAEPEEDEDEDTGEYGGEAVGVEVLTRD